MSARFMIYGASGYTGKLVAQTAKERNLPAILSGRDAAKVTAVAERLGFEARPVRLDDAARLDAALGGVAVVLNVAGPFAATAAPLAEACLRTGTHYLDVAGELSIFQHLHQRDAAARARNVMLMPGVGFNVVASDCLASHVVKQCPAATRLMIGISRTPYVSRGSLRTASTLIDDHVSVCRDGVLISVPMGSREYTFRYGRGPTSSTATSWPDVFTAFLTTGVPNVEAYIQIDAMQRTVLRFARGAAWLWRSPVGQALLNVDTGLLPEGPAYEDQKTHRRAIVVEAEDARGTRVSARLRTPEGYWFTALSSLAIVERVLAGECESGFQTPARVYGPDLVLQLDGVSRDDLSA